MIRQYYMSDGPLPSRNIHLDGGQLKNKGCKVASNSSQLTKLVQPMPIERSVNWQSSQILNRVYFAAFINTSDLLKTTSSF